MLLPSLLSSLVKWICTHAISSAPSQFLDKDLVYSIERMRGSGFDFKFVCCMFYFCSHIHIQKRSLPPFFRSFVPSSILPSQLPLYRLAVLLVGCVSLVFLVGWEAKRVITRDVFFMQLVAQRQVTGKLTSTDPNEGEDKRATQHHQVFVVVVVVVAQFFLFYKPNDQDPRPKRDTFVV